MFHKLDWLHDLDIEYDASTFDTDPFEPQPDGHGTIFPFWVPKGDDGGYVEFTLHATARLYPLPSPRSDLGGHLDSKTGLDRNARRNGAAEHAPRLSLLQR